MEAAAQQAAWEQRERQRAALQKQDAELTMYLRKQDAIRAEQEKAHQLARISRINHVLSIPNYQPRSLMKVLCSSDDRILQKAERTLNKLFTHTAGS